MMGATEQTTNRDRADRTNRTMDWEGFFRDYRKPDFIPGYTIINKLGGGVFGEVYKARKTSIGKYYAIKFLRLQDERLSEQVLKELDAVDHFAQVDHPNLVSIEDRGDVGGIPYIVMGYGGDETLKSALRDGALPRERTLTLYRQVLEGASALHEHSIVHFDLKPANIFIRGEVARVGDYGLSKLMSESRATLSMGRGTPYYMAPEMLRRKGDARSDVYSLGVILFEMLIGRVPFNGDSEWQILKAHETELVEIPAEIPAPLGAFLLQCLDKDPARRFRHCRAQLAAFEAVLAALGGPAAAVPTLMAGVTPTPLVPLAAPRTPERKGAADNRPLAYRRVTGRLGLEDVHAAMRGVLQELPPASAEDPGPFPVRREARRFGLIRVLAFPFRVATWPLRAAFGLLPLAVARVLAVLLVTGALCVGLHFGLQAIILRTG